MEGKSWQVAPDTTVQVVDPMGAEKDGESQQTRRNWASIIISLSMISFVLLMVAIAILLMGPQPPLFYGRRLVMKDLYDDALTPKPMSFQWLQGDKLAYMSESGGVRLLDLNTGTNITLVTELALRQTQAVEFTVSPDLRYVLLRHDVVKDRLYTRTAHYSVYHVGTNHYYPLTLKNAHSSSSGIPPRLQHAQWTARTTSANTSDTPTNSRHTDTETTPPKREQFGRKGIQNRLRSSKDLLEDGSLLSLSSGSALIIICRGSLYYMASPSSEPVYLSPDAHPDTLTYGAPDLLYQEILQEEAALWPSPSGHAILVASFNDTAVRELPVLRYAGGYPSVHALRYATVDTPLPDVALWLYDLASPHYPPSRTRLLPPLSLRGSHYLVGSGWADDGRVWATWVGGDQASAALTLCSAPYWFCSTVLLHHPAGGVSPMLRGVQWAGKWAAFPWASTDPEGCWHSHVALVGEAGGRRAPLTPPRYHVHQVIAANLHQHLVYFRGSELSDMKEGDYNEQIYRSSADGSNDVTCITCHLKNKNVRFSAKLQREEEANVEIEIGGSSSSSSNPGGETTSWDEWTDVLRDVYNWKLWGAQKSYGINQNVGGDEIVDRDYDVQKDEEKLESSDNEGRHEEDEDVSVDGRNLYNQCKSVHGSLSPSSHYLVAACLDDNGVPPSLWVLDLVQSYKQEHNIRQHEQRHAQQTDRNSDVERHFQDTGPENHNIAHGNTGRTSGSQSIGGENRGIGEVSHGDQKLAVSKEAERNYFFGSQENNNQVVDSSFDMNKLHPPLLLHSQSATRVKMSVLGMPITLRTGLLVGGRGGGGVGESTERRPLHARVTLTIPPGWTQEDTSLLYPMVVHLVGPDEPLSSPWGPDGEGVGIRWADYLSSGHHVAHARVQLWGGDPSSHTSAHQLAEYHVHVVRQLLERYDFLDGNNLAVYGRGGLGASIALEAAALTPALFHCVAVVNPITDWHAHGVYWSDRILGSASQPGAEQRYVESDAARLAPEYRNSTPILLVHGTSDQYAHHGFSLAHALNAHAAHFSHVVYPNEPPSLLRPSRHLLAELEYFFFSWIHDPLIYEETEGDAVYDASLESIKRYENRFDIKRSFGKLGSVRA